MLDAIVESAARVCGIDDVIHAAPRGRHDGSSVLILVSIPIAASRRSVLTSHGGGWMLEHGTLHIPDVARAESDFQESSALRQVTAPYLRRASPSARRTHRSDWARGAPRFVPSLQRKSSCSKPSPTRQ